MDNYSLSDLAAITKDNDGFGGGNGAWWIIILFLFVFMGGGGLFGNRNNDMTQSDFAQFATSASQDQILLGQRFDNLSSQLNQLGDGICSSTFALNNSLIGEGRALQTQVANCCCETNRNIDSVKYSNAENTQKILDAISGNRIADMQNQINSLQLQSALCGIPRITNYAYGVTPLNWCNAAQTCTSCGCAV